MNTTAASRSPRRRRRARPDQVDLDVAIQNPATCFRDFGLRAGRVVLGRGQLPSIASGAFARVYQIESGFTKWAVRCGFGFDSTQEYRYSVLRSHIDRACVPSLVHFEYLRQGIRIKRKWYPILKMVWAAGVTLDEFVEINLGDPAALLGVSERIVEAVEQLRGAKIIHGDLQHKNIIVAADGTITLIDYDAMLVPGLLEFPAEERGLAAYQHPERVHHKHEGLDDFSVLVIDTSLRVLAVYPELWEEFNTGGNLIFSAEDFKNPDESPLFCRLLQSRDPAVHEAVFRLLVACSGSITAVPRLAVARSSSFPWDIQQLGTGVVFHDWWRSASAPSSVFS